MTRVDLVSIPAGTWTLGVPEPGPTELPLRRVELPAFRAARAPVTNAEHALFLEATGHEPPPFLDDPALAAPEQPVVGVSWHDATRYLAWLSAETGEPLRLPTCDEREVAARAGRERCRWPWGDEPPESRPELAAIAALDRPHAPAEACANAWGLSCLIDNVHEWCADEAEGRPGRPARRLSCGGSWRHRVRFTSPAARSSLPADRRYADYGFRLFAQG